jgi:glyoxylase-like metal-dependent hydrolase (beta-lactamase superfamily II)
MTTVNYVCVLAAAATLGVAACAQEQSATAAAPRLYIFDAGSIAGLDPQLFNFTREELAEVDFVNVAYLVVHPRGTLLFDTGGVPDSQFTGDGPVTEGVLSASRPLLPQLASAGYTPDMVDYLALSHYHSDHTANANAFAGATWIAQKPDRDFMFGDDPQGIIQPMHYTALRTAKTHLLDNEDFDVFGDGTVVLTSAPGHTPGHQVLLLRLARRGPVVLAGDLYHYPEERGTDRVPTFEFDAEQSRAARQRVEALVTETGAELWIEHDIATHATLPRAPAFVD